MNKSSLDKRPKEEIQRDLISLDVIEELLENEISSFALESPENLFDEEFNEIIRKFEFSRGMKTHLVVIGPDGLIRWISNGFPSILLQEIHNLLIFQVLYQGQS